MVAATEGLYDELVTAASGVAGERQHAAGVVGLVASQFPRNVDAYFLREVAGLAARGIPFRIFSLRSFDGKVIHGAAKPLMARTVYVPFLASWTLWRANALALARTPGRYPGTLSRRVRG